MFQMLLAATSAAPDHTDWNLVYATWALCVITFGLAIYTGRLFYATAQIARESGENSKRQLRAYITVTPGAAYYQDRSNEDPAHHMRFWTTPQVTNTGATPARNARQRSAIGIHPYPLPDHFSFALPDAPAEGMTMANGQFTELQPQNFVDKVPDDEVLAIMRGNGRALYVWGIVYYNDIFGESHETKFCHMITWQRWTDGVERPYTGYVTRFDGMH
jgi:hypothetical protein